MKFTPMVDEDCLRTLSEQPSSRLAASYPGAVVALFTGLALLMREMLDYERNTVGELSKGCHVCMGGK